jgi:uncharacterized protein (TIGR02996 family)
MDEEAFLSAIAADTADDTNRLVYADWLEERGDVRGEYIRLRVKVREPRGRKRIQARLDELSRGIDVEWRGRVFAVPKLAIKKYRRVRQPVTEPVTKFGGQPVWVAGAAWPITRRREPMQFVCQVAVPAFFGPPLAGKMVYVFALHPEHADWEEFCGTISPLYPEEGDNAVVIQPGGDPPAPTWVLPLGAKGHRRRKRPLRVEARATGPTLYDDEGRPGEWLLDLEPGVDPDYTANGKGTFPSDAAWQGYWDQVYGDKIGGTPPWGNGRAWEIDSLAADPDWRLLLHYHSSQGPYFTVWDAGGFEWSVWVTRGGKRGLLMGGR